MLTASTLLLMIASLFCASVADAVIRTTAGSGNWNSTTANAPWPGGTAPSAGDDVVIAAGHTVTVTASITGNACNHLTIEAAGALSIGGYNFNVGGNTTINGTLTITSTSNAKNFLGDVTVNTGGTWNNSINELLTIGGSLRNDGTFTAGTGVYTFSGANKTFSGTNAISIPSLTVSGAYTNEGDLTVATALAGSGTLTQGAGASLTIGDATIAPTLVASASGNTVTYNRAGAQDVELGTYHHLVTGGSGTKTFLGAVTNNGDMIIGSATTLATASKAFTVKGGWTNNGAFTAGTGTVTFNGIAAQSIAGTAATTFNNLTINNNAGVTLGQAATVNGTLTLASGTLNNSSFNVTLGNGATISRATGSLASTPGFGSTVNVTYTAGGVNTGMELPTGSTVLQTLTVDAGAGTVTLGANATVNVALALTSGTLNNSSSTLTLANGITITCATGTLSAAPTFGTTVNVAYTAGGVTTGPELPTSTTVLQALSANNTSGTVTLGTNATVNGTLTVASGGTLSDGGFTLTIKSAAVTLSGTHSSLGSGKILFAGAGAQTFSGTFGNVELNNAAGASLSANTAVNGDFAVTLGVFQPLTRTLTVSGATTVSSSISITSSTGTKTFNAITIRNGGALTESAAAALVFNGDVTIENGGTLTEFGAATVNFSGSLSNNGTYTASTGTHRFTGNGKTFSGTITIATVDNDGSYDNDGTLTISTLNGSSGSLTQRANSTLNYAGAAGTLDVTFTASAVGNTVNYNGAAQTITATTYHHLTTSGSGTKLLGGAVTVNGDLSIGSGTTLDVATSNYGLDVFGDWFNDGAFAPRSGTVTFSGATAQTIGGTALTSFYGLNVDNGAGVTLGTGASVSNALTLTSGSLNNSASNVTFGNGATITRVAGSLTAAPTFGTTVNVSYTGSDATMTGFEIPAGATVLNNVTINDAAGVTLGASATVNGTLTLTSGILTTGANQLNLGTAGTISGASSAKYVNGTVQKEFNAGSQPFTFAIGNASAYLPISLTSMTVGTAGSLTASTTAGDHPAIATSSIKADKSVNRYWTLAPGGGFAAGAYSVTLGFDAGDVDGSASTTRFVVRRHDGSAWSATTTGTRTATSTQATGSNPAGSFAVGEQEIDHYVLYAPSPQTNSVAFNVTVTAQDLLNQTVADDSSTAVTMSGTGSVEFDSNGDTTFGDNAKVLTNGTFAISTIDSAVETIDITATDGNARMGNLSSLVIAPAIGAYRSAADGGWTTLTTWERWNGTDWVTPTSGEGTPLNTKAVTTIRSGHTVTVAGSLTMDELTVEAGGHLTVSSGTLTIGNGAGTDLNVYGTVDVLSILSWASSANATIQSGGVLRNSGTVNGTAAKLIFNAGGKYQHNFTTTAGTIPTATWNSGSTCEIISYTSYSGALSGLNQSFHHFIWNCPDQTATISLPANFTTINGDFGVTSTGGAGINLAANLAVGGTGTVSSGATLNCGTYTVSGGAFALATGGTLGIGAVDGITASGEAGNIRTTTRSFDTGANYIYNGTAAQVAGDGLPAAVKDLTIANSAGVTLGADVTVAGTCAVNSGATLDCGAYVIGGAGAFTLSSGGTLGIGSADGIAATAASGNVRTATRSFDTGANYIYNGTAAQVTGDGLPATVNNLTVNNSAGVVLSGTETVSGTLTLSSGRLATGAYQVNVANTANTSVSGASSDSYVNGTLQKAFTTGSSQSFTFPVGNASTYAPITLASMTVGTAGTLTANTTGSEHSDVGNSGVDSARNVNRYWTLTPGDGLVVSTSSGTFNFVPGDVDDGAAPASFVVRRYAGGTWSATTTGTRTATNTQATALSAFGDFVVGEAAPGKLAFTTQPANKVAGTVFTVVLQIQDQFGNALSQPGTQIDLMLNDGTLAAGTTSQVTIANGSATFNDLVITQTGTNLSLTATGGGLEPAISSTFNITPASAATVQVETAADGSGGVVPAQTIVAGNSITMYCIRRDMYGNFIDNAAATAWSRQNIVGGIVSGDLVQSGDKKSAVFTGHVTGTATIRATYSTTPTVESGTLTVDPGAATRMYVTLPGQIFTAGSGNSGTVSAQTAGTAFNIVKLTATDPYTNIVPSYSGAKTITYAGPGGVPTFTTSVDFSGGQSTTTLGTTLTKAEATTITASDGALTGMASSSLTVNAGAFTKLQLLMPSESADPGMPTGKTGAPSAQTAGTQFSVTVRSVDDNWNLVSSTHSVGITSSDPLFTPPANNTLSGGSRAFSVTLKTSGGQTVTATDLTDGGKLPDTSPLTTVNPAVPSKLALQTQPSATATVGVSFAQQPVVLTLDAYGNLVSTNNSTVVTAARGTGTGTLQGTLLATAAGGVATYTDLNHNKAETMTVVFTASGLTSATSTAVVVSSSGFAKLQLLMPGETAAPGTPTGKTGAPAAQTAGTAFSVTVNAVDDNWNLVNTADDTVHITSSDGSAVLPGNAALVNGTSTFNVTLTTAGGRTVTAEDVTDSGKPSDTSPMTTVNPAAAAKLAIQTEPSPMATAGVVFARQPVVAIQDAYGNLRTGDVSVVTATRFDGAGTLQGTTNRAAVAGVATFTNLSHQVATNITIRFSSGTLTAVTSTVTRIDAAAYTQLLVVAPGEAHAPGTTTGRSGSPTTQAAGTPFAVDVMAVDAYWNVVSNVTDTVHLTSTDANATLPAASALVNGTRTLNLTCKTAASQTITAQDLTDGITTGTSSSITVAPGAFTKMQLIVPGEAIAPGTPTGKTGTPSTQTAAVLFTVTVRAVDDNWNLVSTNNVVGITTTDPYATLTANGALSSGSKVFNVTLKTAGQHTITATNITDGAKTSNTSPAIAANPGTFTKLQLLMPGETAVAGSSTGKTGTPDAQAAGTPFSVIVNAVDANWNVVDTNDTARITSSDVNAALPADAALVAGTQTFSVTFKTAGSKTVTASDVTTPAKTANTSPSTTVTAGAFAKLQVLMPGESAAPGTPAGKSGTPSARTAGTAFNVTVNAVDANWNLVNTVTDSVRLTSSDSIATMPTDTPLVGGTKTTLSVTLKTAGVQTITAEDVTDVGMASDTGSPTAVNPGAASKLAMQTQPSATAAASVIFARQPVVQIQDAFGNLRSSDALAVTAARGAGTSALEGTLTVTSVGGVVTYTNLVYDKAETITLVFTRSGLTSVTSDTIVVTSETFTKLQVLMPGETAAPGTPSGKTGTPSATAGMPCNVTVNAVDDNWNLIASATDTVHLTTSDAYAILPADLALSGGTRTFSLTFKTAVSQTVTATDVTDAGKMANTGSATVVAPGAISKLQLLMPGETAAPGSVVGKTGTPEAQTAGAAFTVTVNGVDDNWNVVPGAHGSSYTVQMTSSDGNATMPGAANLSYGVKTFSITLKTAGAATLTATHTDAAHYPSSTSPSFDVGAGAFTKLQLLMPGEIADPGSSTGKTGTPDAQAAGTPFSVTVNAVDANWNRVGADDTVRITSSDVNAALPVDAALVAGTQTFNVTFRTAGNRTVTATDVTASKTANISPSTTVTAGPFVKLQVLMPGETAAPGTASGKTGTPTTRTAGASFSGVIVNAVDANWNPVSSTDSVELYQSSDTYAVLPVAAALVGGTKTFSMTFKTAGNQSVTARDLTNAGIAENTGSMSPVNAGTFSKLQILMPGETMEPGSPTGKTGSPTSRVAGDTFNVTVNAADANWNRVTTIVDVVRITSSDVAAALPADSPLSAGTRSLGVTFKTAGLRTLTASDITTPARSPDTSPATQVTPGAPNKLDFQTPPSSTATAGVVFAQQPAVLIQDAFGNLVNDDNSTIVTAARALGTGTLRGTLTGTAVDGVVTFTNLWHNKAETITVGFASVGLAGTASGNVVVAPGAFARLLLLAPGETSDPDTLAGKAGTPSKQTMGTAFTVTVHAADAYWNLVDGGDTVRITSGDEGALLPADATLASGAQTFNVTLNKGWFQTVTASDVTNPGISDSLSTIQMLYPNVTVFSFK